MFHLVYTSHSTQQFSEGDLILLLKQCRDSNKLNGITGMLLYLQGKFIQVLEGEKAMVETLYSNIKEDSRHTRIITVMQGTSPKRLFSGWTMGFKKLSFEEAHQLSGFQDIDIFFKQPITEDSNLLLVFLGLFYKKNMVDYAEL